MVKNWHSGTPGKLCSLTAPGSTAADPRLGLLSLQSFCASAPCVSIDFLPFRLFPTIFLIVLVGGLAMKMQLHSHYQED